MEFSMYWGDQPVVEGGDSNLVFGVDTFTVGQRVASGIREYTVVAIEPQPGQATIIRVEPIA